MHKRCIQIQLVSSSMAALVVAETLDSSLPVPSVRELAIQRLETVPTRYIRDDLGEIITTTPSDHHHPSLRVPLIDMTKLVNPDSQEEELQKLHLACTDWGLFQLINHGASTESLKNMIKQVEGFFNLPSDEKKRYAQRAGSLEGYGQAFVVSEEQKLEWCDMIFLKALPVSGRNLSFWPTNPQEFRKTLDIFAENVREVAVSILRFMAMGLGIKAQHFSDAFKEGKYEVRMNCYPTCPEPERVIGIASHADMSGITLLYECGDMPGLQVLKDEQWFFVEPIADAIVVNSGHIVEVMSNGVYKAPDHRAVVNRVQDRFSIVTFCYPNTDVKIGPAEELTKSGSAPLYKTVTHSEYFHTFSNRKLEVPFIDCLKISNAS